MTNTIAVSVGILTRNSASSLPRALESVKHFSDIIICDGGSTDATIEIAKSYKARVIPQDPAFLDATGTLINYGGAKNQCLTAAREKWFFSLDSDEYCSQELVRAIEQVVKQDTKGVFWINRIHTINGTPVMCDTTYPNRQIRFFARNCAVKFVKKVHERIEYLPSIVPELLSGDLYVPFDHDTKTLHRKWNHYIALEIAQRQPIEGEYVARVMWSSAKTSLLYLFRLVRNILFCRGPRMPLSTEMAWYWYQWRLVTQTWRAWRTQKHL